jgi:predicted nucleotidyltransferase
MATINYRLQKLAEELFIKHNSKEREYIDVKIINFKRNIALYFGNQVDEILVFGSFSRSTILPRQFDESSDIDVLIVFNQQRNAYNSETYRNQLKRFAVAKYPTTKVLKDHPSIVLEMQKIKFDLVPSRYVKSFWNNSYQIPNRESVWIDTDPKGFNSLLTTNNNKYNFILKPIIRLIKRWNAINDYPYKTFELEQLVAKMDFSGDNYEKGFFYAVENLSKSNLSIYQAAKVNTLQKNVQLIKEKLENNDQAQAEVILMNILHLKYK